MRFSSHGRCYSRAERFDVKDIEYAAARVMTGTARVVMTAMASGAATAGTPADGKAADQMEMAIRPKNNQAALADVAQSPPLYSICQGVDGCGAGVAHEGDDASRLQ